MRCCGLGAPAAQRVKVDDVGGEFLLELAQLGAPARRQPGARVEALHGFAAGPGLVGHDAIERGILAQDRLLQAPQLGSRLQPQCLDERVAGVAERVERLGLPARAVKGQHQQRPEALAQRVLVDQRAQPADRLAVAPGVEVVLERQLGGRKVQLLQPAHLRGRERLLAHAGERGSVPERERLARQLTTGAVAVGGSGHEPLELQRVDRRRVDLQLVAASVGRDPRRAILGQQPAQLGDVLLHHLRGGRRRLLAPEPLDQPLDRDGRVGAQRQHREHGALLRASELERTVVQVYVDGAQ